jgi:NAD(P)-dependent dehydrogenase (short-subunit alcohol dehydrogenase family)
MIQTFNLQNKIILVTGGYGHLGKAISESLAFHGAKVYVLGRNRDGFNKSFASTDADLISRLFFQSCDVSNTEQIAAAYKTIFEKEGKIDVLVNNAAYSRGQNPETLSDEDWDFGIEGTIGSLFKCLREIIPFFKESGAGKIINVSSMYGMVAPQFEIYDDFPQFLNPPHYGAGKAAIIQLTKYYSSFLGKYNINVNAVTPGPFPSEAVQKTEGFVKELEKKTSLGRIGHPEDLAGAFVFLSSEASNFITGQNIVVDGGWTSK